MIGQVLSGLYKIDRRIGEGGMGRVYMAVHIHLNKPFAVKVLSEKIATNRQAVERLRIEAQTASSIDHDNIIDVVSFDTTDDGRVFLVMEMLEGESLAELIQDGPMNLERALPIVYQICEALEAAHERGIVHRDLKPENVFIVRKRDTDFVKVLDFGISKIKTAEAEQVRMTKTGQVVGTPLYMAPEQARGETDIDRRADVYALGVMLYEMLAGRPPFLGGNYFQLLWKHGNEAPQPPSRHRPDLPAAIDDAILRALEKDPADRYPSMAAFEAALMAAAPEVSSNPARLMSVPPPYEPQPPSPWQRLGPLLAALVVLVAAGAAAFVASRQPEPPPQTQTQTSQPTPAQPTAPAPRPEPAGSPQPEADQGIPEGTEPPSTTTVRFESTPPGAQVLHGGVVLGTTPFDATLPAGVPLTVTFRRAGYRPANVEVTPTRGARVEKRLVARASGMMRRNPSLPTPRMSL